MGIVHTEILNITYPLSYGTLFYVIGFDCDTDINS